MCASNSEGDDPKMGHSNEGAIECVKDGAIYLFSNEKTVPFYLFTVISILILACDKLLIISTPL